MLATFSRLCGKDRQTDEYSAWLLQHQNESGVLKASSAQGHQCELFLRHTCADDDAILSRITVMEVLKTAKDM